MFWKRNIVFPKLSNQAKFYSPQKWNKSQKSPSIATQNTQVNRFWPIYVKRFDTFYNYNHSCLHWIRTIADILRTFIQELSKYEN